MNGNVFCKLCAVAAANGFGPRNPKTTFPFLPSTSKHFTTPPYPFTLSSMLFKCAPTASFVNSGGACPTSPLTLITSLNAFSPNVFLNTDSTPPFIVACELAHDAHAPNNRTATIPSSSETATTSMFPPSLITYGRISSNASSTVSFVSLGYIFLLFSSSPSSERTLPFLSMATATS